MQFTKTQFVSVKAFIKAMGEVRVFPIISMLKVRFGVTDGSAARIFKEYAMFTVKTRKGLRITNPPF